VTIEANSVNPSTFKTQVKDKKLPLTIIFKYSLKPIRELKIYVATSIKDLYQSPIYINVSDLK
jgi:hypothetical protein